MILELMGLPGCGKTYLANMLVDEFKDRERICINVTEISRNKAVFKVMFKLLRIFFRLKPSNRKLMRECKRILKEYLDRNAEFNIVLVDSYIENILFQRSLYKVLEKKKDLFIFDEGISQQYVNIIANYSVDDKTISKLIESTWPSARLIWLQCDMDTVISSSKKRDRHVCYIDELRGNALHTFLNTYFTACSFVSQKLHANELNRGEDYDDILQCVCSLIN